jgi:hypothetical protein
MAVGQRGARAPVPTPTQENAGSRAAGAHVWAVAHQITSFDRMLRLAYSNIGVISHRNAKGPALAALCSGGSYSISSRLRQKGFARSLRSRTQTMRKQLETGAQAIQTVPPLGHQRRAGNCASRDEPGVACGARASKRLFALSLSVGGDSGGVGDVIPCVGFLTDVGNLQRSEDF